MLKLIIRKLRQLYFTWYSAKKLKRNLKRFIKGFVPCIVLFCVFVSSVFCLDSNAQDCIYTPLSRPQLQNYFTGGTVAWLATNTPDYGNTLYVFTRAQTFPYSPSSEGGMTDVTITLNCWYTPNRWNVNLQTINNFVSSDISTVWCTLYNLDTGKSITSYPVDLFSDVLQIAYSDNPFWLMGEGFATFPDNTAIIPIYWNTERTTDYGKEIVDNELDDGGYSDSSKTQKNELDGLNKDTQVDEPSADDVDSAINDALNVADSKEGFNLLKTITDDPLVTTMICIVFGMAILGYILFGKR